jgi:uncharacterized Zn-finger protein
MRHRVACRTLERPWKKFHHPRIGVEFGERRDVRCAPLPQDEPRGS